MSDAEHAWASAHEEFNTSLLPRLKSHGIAIAASMNAGDEDAKEIIQRYTMLYRSFDPVTMQLCTDALARWEAKQPVT